MAAGATAFYWAAADEVGLWQTERAEDCQAGYQWYRDVQSLESEWTQSLESRLKDSRLSKPPCNLKGKGSRAGLANSSDFGLVTTIGEVS